jgi:hypothetical protein|tara:strand:+ start:3390 stop:3818 length:429 start_codon:yes stop_codon:yes gene_type:complete
VPTRRTQIIDAFRDHIVANTDVLDGNCQRFFVYLHEINDFPFIAFLPQEEIRNHRGAGRKIAVISIFIRAYVYNGDDPQTEAETIGFSIEQAIETFAPSATARSFKVEEARVISFRTDEGLFKPYGLADFDMQIVYEVSNDI